MTHSLGLDGGWCLRLYGFRRKGRKIVEAVSVYCIRSVLVGGLWNTTYVHNHYLRLFSPSRLRRTTGKVPTIGGGPRVDTVECKVSLSV